MSEKQYVKTTTVYVTSRVNDPLSIIFYSLICRYKRISNVIERIVFFFPIEASLNLRQVDRIF